MIEHLFSIEWNNTGICLLVFKVDKSRHKVTQVNRIFSSNFVGVGVDAAPFAPNKILEILYA